MTLYITFASCQLYWVFKEAEIQAIGLALDATKKEERESKFEIEKENASQEDMEFEGGKTMRYEFEKLRVMLVSGEMRERERFFFCSPVCIYRPKQLDFAGTVGMWPVRPIFFPVRNKRGICTGLLVSTVYTGRSGRYGTELISLVYTMEGPRF